MNRIFLITAVAALACFLMTESASAQRFGGAPQIPRPIRNQTFDHQFRKAVSLAPRLNRYLATSRNTNLSIATCQRNLRPRPVGLAIGRIVESANWLAW